MKNLLKLCLVTVRKNKWFTVGIFLMSILSFAVAFLGVNFSHSSQQTMEKFLYDSNPPQAIYLTEFTDISVKDQIESIEGVKSVTDEIVVDTAILSGDNLFSVRLFSWDENAPYKQTYHSRESVIGEKASIYYKFAEYNGIFSGDTVMVLSPNGNFEVVIEATVSNPETMDCVKDEMSIYEDNQFAYLYAERKTVKSAFDIGDKANRWLIYFEDTLSDSEEKAVMESIAGVFGNGVIDKTLVKDSDALKSLKDDLTTIGVLSSFIPCVIWLISLGFGFIFIKIIIENQKRTIGLLRALGYSAKYIIFLFVFLTLLINFIALFIGTFIGYVLLSLCVKIIAGTSGIVDFVISVRYGLSALSILAVFVIGVLSALMSAKTITKIDPSEAYNGSFNPSTKPPKILSRVKTGAFFKISLGSLFRKPKRQIVSVLCIVACIISICIGLEGYYTVGHPIDAVYGERYHYDITVRGINTSDYNEIKSSVDEIDIIEPFTYFSGELNGEKVKVSTLPVNAKLTTLYGANGESIEAGSGVIVDEMRAKINGWKTGDTVKLNGTSLTVTGIAREILYTVIFISEDTANQMGYAETNGAMITLKKSADIKTVEEKILSVSRDAYVVEFSSQKENITNGFKAMRTVMAIFAVIAFGIGSLIVINLTLIDFNEDKTKFATLRALGTPVGKIGGVSAISNLFRIILGIIVAIPITYFALTVLLDLISTPSQQYVLVKFVKCLSVSCAVPLLYVVIGMAVSLKKIKSFDFCSYLNQME